MLTKIKLEYSNILYNLTHFSGHLERQIPQYIYLVNKQKKKQGKNVTWTTHYQVAAV
jgi:hypothetical protein